MCVFMCLPRSFTHSLSHTHRQIDMFNIHSSPYLSLLFFAFLSLLYSILIPLSILLRLPSFLSRLSSYPPPSLSPFLSLPSPTSLSLYPSPLSSSLSSVLFVSLHLFSLFPLPSMRRFNPFFFSQGIASPILCNTRSPFSIIRRITCLFTYCIRSRIFLFIFKGHVEEEKNKKENQSLVSVFSLSFSVFCLLFYILLLTAFCFVSFRYFSMFVVVVIH